MTSLPETMSQIRSFVMWIRVSLPHAPKYCPDWSSLEVLKLRTCSEIGRKNAENQPVQKRPLLREDYVPEMVDSIIVFVHLDWFDFFQFSQIPNLDLITTRCGRHIITILTELLLSKEILSKTGNFEKVGQSDFFSWSKIIKWKTRRFCLWWLQSIFAYFYQSVKWWRSRWNFLEWPQ